MLSAFDPLVEKWSALSQRDQYAAIALSIALLLSIVIFGIIGPIANLKATAQQKNASATTVLNELTLLAPQAMAAGKSTGQAKNSLNSDVRRQAARNGVEIQRFEPDGNFLKVWLEDIRYPAVIQWLGALESVGVGHYELAIEDRPNPGLVSVRVTLGYY